MYENASDLHIVNAKITERCSHRIGNIDDATAADSARNGTDEVHPWPVSTFQVPEADEGFCARGGRFGPHGTQWSMNDPFYKNVQVFSWFNAGMRAVDVRDPFEPREIAYYIPATTATTDQRCVTIGGVERCKTAIQTNNVEVDDRGLVYLVDRANTGLHIVELTGSAAALIGR